jgi:hypothetical protein
MREVKAETFADAPSHQFDATYERAISTLRTSFEARYHKYSVTGIWHYRPNFPALVMSEAKTAVRLNTLLARTR